MRSLLAFAILAAAMYVCGISDKPDSETGASNAAPVRAPAKPDKESVKRELLQMEEEMTDAAMKGDITLLVKNTTDDFKLTGVDGKVQTKNEKDLKAFSITDADLLSFSDDSAVMSYTLNLTLKNGRSGKAKVTDTFVKKDGRWLIKGEQQ